MTPNQKAASAVKWSPGQRCQGLRSSEDGRPAWGFCSCGYWGPVGQSHAVPEPDMSRPQNYMRALEAVACRKPYLDLELKSLGCEDGKCLWVFGGAREGESRPFIETRHSMTDAGSAIVPWLAALYDAEHPESAEVHA